ncbi:MAG: substrate-binding domain-containing protein, partial [Candidatus Krumholzibacteria bacterium]|nr:substrate-binding domain-containing protein [Candidatus Krumholzibacteria bacterium]
SQFDWSRLTAPFQNPAPTNASLVIAGHDLAPAVIDNLALRYHRDYPALEMSLLGGGTHLALENLVNKQAAVAFLTRPPTPAEQDLFRQVDGDTAIVEPVAVGGLLLLAGAEVLVAAPDDTNTTSLTTTEVSGLLAGDLQGLCDRFYAADPNYGHWAAAAQLLGRDPEPTDAPTVTYLATDQEVVRAVTNDPRALGMVVSFDLSSASASTFDSPADSVPGPRLVPISGPDGGPPAAPTYENVASGDYPLFVSLMVACRTNGGIEGAKFVTHLASGPGQRQIERNGCIPARRVLREVILKTETLVQ